MNNHPSPGPGGGNPDRSALSFLVNAAEGRDANAGGGSRNISDALRARGLGGADAGRGAGAAASLEEQLLLQQHAQSLGAAQPGYLQYNRGADQNLLSQIVQQQQLASLLGLNVQNPMTDMQAALAAAQLQQQQQQQQQQQLTQADLVALSRSGALPGLSGLLGGAAGLGAAGGQFTSELEGLQRLEELEHRQRLLAATGRVPPGAAGPAGLPNVESADLPDSPMSRPKVQVEKVEQQFMPHTSIRRRQAKTADTAVSAEPSPGVDVPETEDKERLEKAPGSVIVPCRARGMPMDHNFKTAYFVIPENVKHGEELICSYFACRNAGIKFRYCSHCKVPVAKRNFRKRHKHGGKEVAMLPGDDSDEEGGGMAGIPSQITANTKEVDGVEADGISSQSADSNAEKEGDQKDLAPQRTLSAIETSGKRATTSRGSSKGKEPKRGGAVKNKKGAGGDDDDDDVDERTKRWMQLLAKRPSTKDEAMNSWLMEVLAVSDHATPLQPLVAAEQQETKAAAKIPKKAPSDSALNTTESPRSDIGYGSSDEYEKSGGGGNNDEINKSSSAAEPRRTALLPPFAAGIVKKKRPADLLQGEPASLTQQQQQQPQPQPPQQQSESYTSGSFAAWKAKKQKQAKMSGDEA